MKRTQFSPNEIRLYETHAEIVLYNKKNEEKATTKISLEMIEKVKNIKWALSKQNYVVNSKVGRLHRFLLDVADSSLEVDHIDGDTLNNMTTNLRICSHQENMYNRKKHRDNTSGYVGITITKSNTYRARIKVDKKELSKTCTTLEEAIQWRKEQEQKHHKNYSRNWEETNYVNVQARI